MSSANQHLVGILEELIDELDQESTPPSKPGEEKTGEGSQYELIECIGEGGFGTVWRAWQTVPVRRQVAIKEIRRERLTHDAIRRFNAERQTLSLMNHPSIATILDGGTDSKGNPFFVMEFVDGIPITKFCSINNLSLTQRLEIFESVCRAIQHAHDKGVLHRDLKPTNILVTEFDGKPFPKVIDFGISKLVSPSEEGDLQTLYPPTATGVLIGTPQYMSPEQAQGVESLDERSDIYSLGAILYEMLTGSATFGEQKDLLKLRHLISESEIQRPSLRIADQATEKSERDIPSQRVKGDLDTITMYALNKEPERRYQSAAALADDINCYLSKKPIRAKPSSAIYKCKRFFQRNRTEVLALVALLLVVIIGLPVYTWQADRIKETEKLHNELKIKLAALENRQEKPNQSDSLQTSPPATPSFVTSKEPTLGEANPKADDDAPRATGLLAKLQAGELPKTGEIGNLLKAGSYSLMNELLEKRPKLVYLILNTGSMDNTERQYWFDILPSMTTEQVNKLEEILVGELKKLADLEYKYEEELAALDLKHLNQKVQSIRTRVKEKPHDLIKKIEFIEFLFEMRKFDSNADLTEAYGLLSTLPLTVPSELRKRVIYLELLSMVYKHNFHDLTLRIAEAEGTQEGHEELAEISEILSFLERFDLASQAAAKAVEFTREINPPNKLLLAKRLYHLSFLQIKAKNFIDGYFSAVEGLNHVSEDLGNSAHSENHKLGLNLLSSLYHGQKETGNGSRALEALNSINSNLTRIAQPNTYVKDFCSEINFYKGCILHDGLSLREALESLKNAQSIWRTLFKAGQTNPQLQNYKRGCHKYCEVLHESQAFQESTIVWNAFVEDLLALEEVSASESAKVFDEDEVASAFGNLAWHQIFSRDFLGAVESCNRALAMSDLIWIKGNLAHALLFSGNTDKAREIYTAQKNQSLEIDGSPSFIESVELDFVEFRKGGLNIPEMVEVEQELGITKSK
jgi:serine/threonine protein kinase